MIPMNVDVGDGSLAVLSMGLLAPEEQALLWRGLIVQRAVQQFIEDAHWGDVDYLLIDTPPGTRDIAMALARLLPQTGHILITTPSPAAQSVAARAGDFARKSNVRVLGVIENMSGLDCESGRHHDLFGAGGGQALADQMRVPLLASVPLRAAVADGGDVGVPAALSTPELTTLFAALAQRLVEEIAPPLGAQGCSARLLDALDSAVASAPDRSVVEAVVARNENRDGPVTLNEARFNPFDRRE
jgi:ATP-binding protein involved in chromosome partitioning